MKIYSYRSTKLDKKARLFDPGIRDDPWVLFHGTSSAYETQIESRGLDTGHLPVTLEELRKLLGIFKSMNWRYANYVSSLKAWSFPEAVEDRELRPIFLASVPELAACYCGRRSVGGEIAEMVRGCIRELRGFLREKSVRAESLRLQWEEHEDTATRGIRLPVIEVSRPWVRSRLADIVRLEQRLLQLQRGHRYGIVYAMRFECDDVKWLHGSGDTYISDKGVSPERIIAKARIHGSICDHLDRWPERYYRDYTGDDSLIGRIAAQTKRPAVMQEQAIPVLDSDHEWNHASADPTAGEDLTRTMNHESLHRYLCHRHPGIFEVPDRHHDV